jgi:1,2-dihydroxy-3-keto-5-methylthiopentene dioxygenase
MSVLPVSQVRDICNPLSASQLSLSLPVELTNMGVYLERWDVGDVDLTNVDLKNPTAGLIKTIVKGNENLVDRLYEFRTPDGIMDIVNLYPDMPGLDKLLVKFKEIHYHATPEIRLILNGEGIFYIFDQANNRFEVTVHRGDLFFIPSGVIHNFELTGSCAIQALRVFQTKDGWVSTPVENLSK